MTKKSLVSQFDSLLFDSLQSDSLLFGNLQFDETYRSGSYPRADT